MGKKKCVAAPGNQKIIPLHMDATFFFERAVRSLDRYRYDKAIKYFRRAVDYEPENPVNHCNLAGILSEIGKYSESNQILQRIVDEVDPTMTECYFYMANNFANMEDFEAAEKAIIHYLENDEEGQFVQESEEMMEYLSYELERPSEPAFIKSREGLFEHDKARSLLEQGQFGEAVKLLKRVIKKYPEFLAAKNNLALAYYYMGHFTKAMETISQVLDQEEGNLHALCNLAIFYQNLGDRERLERLAALLRKTCPYHQEHVFKLATTMGILGEHEAAYQLFRRLTKGGLCGVEEDPSLFHYIAVACVNTGRYAEAERHWQQAARLDPASKIPPFYLTMMERRDAPEGQGLARPFLSYHYHLPFEEQFRSMEKEEGELLPETIRKDPLVRSSFFWALRHGDMETKLQVIQAFGLIADHEVKEALTEFLLDPLENDYLKRVAMFVLRTMKVSGPYTVMLEGELTEQPAQPYAPALPGWEAEWTAVLDLAFSSMNKRYDLVQQHDLETLWVEYLSRVFPAKPRMAKPESWAAALEYLTAKMHRRSVTYEEIAARYQISISAARTCVKHIDDACGLRQKMKAIYEGTRPDGSTGAGATTEEQ
ncbi:tetratricopeptide repeat protein [Paenibacillus mesotrionivorans]|jgi:tetratricopeptide (TPR) repeat protein|uniref:Tetratricopeptide repeat protein n=1 Tax=Paenibacillus mesotrionivorans TaxID=3160968 RepID=A0ACC7NWV4_9BACL